MARDDWYRNLEWSDAIEAEFLKRLARSRRKGQFIRIQASYLTDSAPGAALSLLDRYFTLGDQLDLAQAYVVKARAQTALGNSKGALTSYEAAMSQEQKVPSVMTQAYLEYACLIADARLEGWYGRALEILDVNSLRPTLAIERYRAHGARALLLSGLGKDDSARKEARLAISAAKETKSSLRYHQDLGLVATIDDEFGARIAALAE